MGRSKKRGTEPREKPGDAVPDQVGPPDTLDAPAKGPDDPVEVPDEAPAPSERGRRGTRAKRRLRHQIGIVLACLAVVGVIVTAVVADHRPVAPARMVLVAGLTSTTPGTEPTISWPAEGQGAYGVPALGVHGASPTQAAVPIGSLAKMATALVVLGDHPLTPGQEGPSITINLTDVADYQTELATDQSNVAIRAGEVLTEHQLLEGMLVRSGNDYANALARWDAASVPSFVTKMNALGGSLGLTQTHYSDPSGFDPATTSTAADQLSLATTAMADPVFAAIVAKTSVALPVAGTVETYTPLFGSPGVVGVKSGLTTEAGGCDVMAFNSTRAGRPVLVLTAVLGQIHATDRLLAAGQAALALAHQVDQALVAVPAASPTSSVGTLEARSGSSALVGASTITMPSWPGLVVEVSPVLRRRITGGLGAGSTVGTIEVRSGQLAALTGLRTAQEIPGISLWERLG